MTKLELIIFGLFFVMAYINSEMRYSEMRHEVARLEVEIKMIKNDCNIEGRL